MRRVHDHAMNAVPTSKLIGSAAVLLIKDVVAADRA